LSEPDRAPLRAAVDELIASGFRDPEGLFYQAIKLAHAGDLDRAVEILADAVDRGFYPRETFTRHAWLDPLRGRQDFEAILEKALWTRPARVGTHCAGGCGKLMRGIEPRNGAQYDHRFKPLNGDHAKLFARRLTAARELSVHKQVRRPQVRPTVRHK
jgi:hypothetical protein